MQHAECVTSRGMGKSCTPHERVCVCRHDKQGEHAEFIIDETFGVPGVGTVIAGTVKKGCITTGSSFLLGPDVGDGTFKPCAIKSIHYKRLPVQKVTCALLWSIAYTNLHLQTPPALSTSISCKRLPVQRVGCDRLPQSRTVASPAAVCSTFQEQQAMLCKHLSVQNLSWALLRSIKSHCKCLCGQQVKVPCTHSGHLQQVLLALEVSCPPEALPGLACTCGHLAGSVLWFMQHAAFISAKWRTHS